MKFVSFIFIEFFAATNSGAYPTREDKERSRCAHAEADAELSLMVGHPAFPGSGHCGILDFDGAGIAAGEFIVNRRYDEWLDGTSGFRRYKNEK